MSQKPHLAFLVPGPITAEKVAFMLEKLTGKKMTPEEIEASRQRLIKLHAAKDAEEAAAKQAGLS